MAVSPTPVFTQGVMTAQAVCTLAKTTYNDTTSAVLAFTAGPNGAILYGAKVNVTGNAALTQCMLLTNDGTNTRPFAYAVMSAYTLATNTLPPTADFGYTETAPRRLAPNEKVYAATAVANAAGLAFDFQYENL